MTEITTSAEWLKAATHCVLEHWCDADAWLWNVPEEKRCRPNTQRWKGFLIWKEHFDHYNWEDPVHVAIYNALCFHLNPESGPKDSRAPEWSHGVRPKDEIIQGLERLINGDPEPEPEVVAVSENLPDYEDLPLEVIELTPDFEPDPPEHVEIRPMRPVFQQALEFTSYRNRARPLCPRFREELDPLWSQLLELEDVDPRWTNQECRVSDWFSALCISVEDEIEKHKRQM